MNQDAPTGPRAPHPFFHTMVVMGSALALGCGGLSGSKAGDDDAEGAGTGGTGNTAGTGGTGGSSTAGTGGSATSSGGTGTTSPGGRGGGSGTGGSIIVGMGGTGTMPVPPGPFACAPETWDCAQESYCWGQGYQLPSGCSCDEKRPASAEDCAADESFACRQARTNEQGQVLTEPVSFGCECVPTASSNCNQICEQAFGDETRASQGNCISTDTSSKGKQSVLCGCAQIVLR